MRATLCTLGLLGVLLGPPPGVANQRDVSIHPPLDGVEPALVDQIQDARQLIEDLADGTAAELAEAWGEVGMLYQALELNEAALAAYAAASLIHRLDGRWSYLSGMIEASRGNGERARQHFLVAIALQPELAPAAWTRIARLLLDLGQPEQALGASERALAFDDRSAAALAVSGEALLALERYQPAREAIERALELEPRANRLHYPLAMALRGLGNTDAMQSELARVGSIGVTPDDPVASYLAEHARGSRLHTLRARAAFRAGDHQAALELFDRASKATPDDPVVWTNLGTVQAALSQHDDAVASLGWALGLDRGSRTARLNLANVLVRTGRSEKALEVLSETPVATLNKAPDLRLRRARLARQLGRWNRAADDYLAWLDERKDLVVWREALAVLMRAGRHSETLALGTHSGLNAVARQHVAELADSVVTSRTSSLADLALADSLSAHLAGIDPSADHARLRVRSLLSTQPGCQAALRWLIGELKRDELGSAYRQAVRTLSMELARQPRCQAEAD